MPNDAAQIAYVHVGSWKTTYRNIISADFLDRLNVPAKTKYWESVLNNPSENVFVAECDGVVVGFATSGPGRDKNGFDSELYAIYILQEHQQKSIGTLLLKATAAHLQNTGYRSLYVWVLADNNSRIFYERLGGEIFDSKVIEIGGQELTEVAYGWGILEKLVGSGDQKAV